MVVYLNYTFLLERLIMRIRKDHCINTKMSDNMKILLDTVAQYRGQKRSEYIRHLILADLKNTMPAILGDILDETVVKQGRPWQPMDVSVTEQEARIEYGKLQKEFALFLGAEDIGNKLFTKVLNEPCLVIGEEAINYDDFVALDKERREELLTQRYQDLQDMA